MSRGTIFNFLRYLALKVAEEKTQPLSKDELSIKLKTEEFDLIDKNLDCAYILYVKYIDEYKSEIAYREALTKGE